MRHEWRACRTDGGGVGRGVRQGDADKILKCGRADVLTCGREIQMCK